VPTAPSQSRILIWQITVQSPARNLRKLCSPTAVKSPGCLGRNFEHRVMDDRIGERGAEEGDIETSHFRAVQT
jgi:hypothetical protein